MFSGMMPYEKLYAWQACHRLYVEIHRITSRWPSIERYVIVTQLRRATLSAGSCIAEGVVKRGQVEFARYLGIALGSLSEASSQLRAARDTAVAREEDFEYLEGLREKASQLTWRLYQSARGTRGLDRMENPN
jgi:four helix bundle protein